MSRPAPAGAFTEFDGEAHYRISGYDRMPPFFMTLAGNADLWMFITSRGGLTAGRVDPAGALFPYETVDRLMDGHHHTGPITLIRVRRDDGSEVLWQPFPERPEDEPRVERNLYKNIPGTRLVFEAIHPDLAVAFRYRWAMSDEFGLVRTATLTNRGRRPLHLHLLDGLRNVLPFGAPLALYQQSSCLVDAYKRTECDPQTGLAIVSLTARITDRAHAAEELRASTVWCHGLPGAAVALSLEAIDVFRRGEAPPVERVSTGRRAHYLAVAPLELSPGAAATWHILADTGQDAVRIAGLGALLPAPGDRHAEIEESLRAAGTALRRIVAGADGLQWTGRREESAHHFANVLFNTMRGGVFFRNHDVPVHDLRDLVRTRNRVAADRNAAFFADFPLSVAVEDLRRVAPATGDADLERLCLEYLPIWFGRRHGDPSRPWNRFAIHVKNAEGERLLHYEGNWRDIFQNWEALAVSFPAFLPGMVARFVNASTVDGFNPYRLTRDGVDWEVPDSRDPWSHIGYWGDHQIIYLLKFLEMMPRALPGVLESLLTRDIFSYTDVPYRLRSYREMIADPRNTIDFDAERAARIAQRVERSGTDGKLVLDGGGRVHHVNLFEKLLVAALSRLSSFVPGGGIWMNTQRPEWNDANNALVGNGVSMVTLCYLRRYLDFLARLPGDPGTRTVSLSREVAEWFRGLAAVFATRPPQPDPGADPDRERLAFLDEAGEVFSAYRGAVYASGFSGRIAVPVADIVAFIGKALEHLDVTIRGARRDDGLYHAYMVLEVAPGKNALSVQPLYEMLEGQVAALSSGLVTPEEADRILSALFSSRMYRPDQESFLLYPERILPGFLEKNRIPPDSVTAVPLLRGLLDAGEVSIVARDAGGTIRFNAAFSRAEDLSQALDRLGKRPDWAARVERDRDPVMDLFEATFHHASYTGRSGTMYGYEGLGCIYWHMVSKLLLAVQEIIRRAVDSGERPAVVAALIGHYYRIRSGLGFEKSPAEYGAFPTDPYSHTPAHGGAQQPGMTGQVKEEILTRFGELGVQVEDGRIRFRPVLLRDCEFRSEGGRFRCFDITGEEREIDVPAAGLAFTFVQVPVVYTRTAGDASIRVTAFDGATTDRPGDQLDVEQSRAVLNRTGTIARIDVAVADGSRLA